MKKNFWKLIFIICLIIVVPNVSFANSHTSSPPTGTTPSEPTGTTPSDPCAGKICNPIPKVKNLPDLIRILLEGALKLGIPIIALAVIYAGFLFVAARGNEEKLTTAKQTLLYTLIGAAILLGSWAIAQLISETVDALK